MMDDMTNPKPEPLNKASLAAPAIPPKAGEVVWAGVPDGTSETGVSPSLAIVEPTQVRRPWRSTVRTAFQATVALAAMWGLIVQALGLPDWAWVGASVAVAAGITRVMALPGVETFLRTFLPFLSAAPSTTKETP